MTTVAEPRDLDDLVRLEDPRFYAEDAYEVFARLHTEAPLFRYKPLGVWLVTKYDDIKTVGKRPHIFSSAGGHNLKDLRVQGISQEFFGEDNLITTDPPKHRELRAMIAPSFSPTAMAAMEQAIRDFVVEVLDSLPAEKPFDFVEKVAAVVPIKTILTVIGIPPTYVEELKYWSDEMMKSGSALPEEQIRDAMANAAPLEAFINEWIVRRIGEPGNDLISTLVKAKGDGAPITYEMIHMFMTSTLVAGNETTRDYLAGSMHALAEHPEQMTRLTDHRELIPDAMEELLRWVTPVRGFLRRVVEDTELRGQELKAGDRIFISWTAANRDPEIWENATRLDISRKPDPKHIAFGFGEHICAGASLARLEIRVFWEEFLKRFSHWELAGEPVRPDSTMHNSFDSLPLILHSR